MLDQQTICPPSQIIMALVTPASVYIQFIQDTMKQTTTTQLEKRTTKKSNIKPKVKTMTIPDVLNLTPIEPI